MNEDLSRLLDPLSKEPLKRDGEAMVNSKGDCYPIVGGVPRFVAAENYAADFGSQWNRFPKTQLDSYTGLTLSEERLARCFRGELEEIRGKRVLEAGSGAGRFTEVLLKHGAVLDTFDFSRAVEANATNHAEQAFTLVQADIRAMPFAAASYGYVVCLGVIQHTPSPEESIAKLWEMVAPGGRLIIDHYRWNIWLRLPPPIGDAEKFYRQVIRRLPSRKRFKAVKAITDFWFPVYWATRNSVWAQRLLSRIGGIHFYYPELELGSRELHYEWSLLDTHDGMTDAYKRYRDVHSIRRTLEGLGAVDIHVWVAGNGVEAWCRRRSSGE